MSLIKWQISKKNFMENSLMSRFNHLDKDINLYLKKNTEKHLHKVRIDLRRLRFTLEVFSIYFKKEICYYKFYNVISKLQNTTGGARDLDVMKEYCNKNNINIDVEKDKVKLNLKAKEKLIKFIKSKCYNKFEKLIAQKKRM